MIQIVGKDMQGEVRTLLVDDSRVTHLPSNREAVLAWIELFVDDFSEILDFATDFLSWESEEWQRYYKNWMED